MRWHYYRNYYNNKKFSNRNNKFNKYRQKLFYKWLV